MKFTHSKVQIGDNHLRTHLPEYLKVQFSSVAQLCPTLCYPMNCSTPGLPVHHQLPESTQTHVHWVGDAIQPSPPVSPSPPGLNLSQHQGLFQWVSSLHQVAKVLELQLQHQSFQWMNIQGWFPLRLTGLISLLSEELSRVLSSTIIQKHQHTILCTKYKVKIGMCKVLIRKFTSFARLWG